MWTNLFTRSPQFKGQGSSLKAHVVELWLASSFFFRRVPHSQTISLYSHSCWCCWISILLNSWEQRSQGFSIWSHWVTWVFAVSSGNLAWHQRHSPSTVANMLLANRFLQKADTGRLHIWHVVAVLFALNCSTQNPQKLWPHGVAISASRTGFLLQK